MEDGIITYLDKKEEKLLEILTKDYEKFIEPGPIQKQLIKAQGKVSEITPEKWKTITADTIKKASDLTVIKKVLEKAGDGFYVVQENSSRLTFNKRKIVESLNKGQFHIEEYPEICTLRSYHIEKVALNRRKVIDLPSAMVGGGATGFFGLAGVPFNLAYTFFIYFRSVQAIGLYYGYDIVDDPRELEFASSVTVTCLSPHLDSEVKNLGSIISKMMLAANVSSLKESLSKLTYTQMAQKGGAELLYVQIRAVAHAAAKKALKEAGKEGLEAGVFQKLLEQLGKKMTQETGKKAVPFVGAIIGALADTYTMNKILYGANLIYHKRFLFEKSIRIQALNDQKTNPNIIDYEE
ncbi:EcsC family protein [Metabacillus bambusae]|uniref:EcsC family protein n=1 Tax=Metabacillus bambusae TaxID=2795218 RepID=A0ABS3MZQ4_9BACI|nr:EcsC family protein [Metabacillus bambusae]MBO1511148.1 EcsC family protein [Metabacillus bambusae]